MPDNRIGRRRGPRPSGGGLLATQRVIARCRHELTLLRALCDDPDNMTAAELAVILAYVETRAQRRPYDETLVEAFLVGSSSTPAALERAASAAIVRLDRNTLPAFRKAAVLLASVAGTPPAVALAWESLIDRAIDEQEQRDAVLLRNSLNFTDPGDSVAC